MPFSHPLYAYGSLSTDLDEQSRKSSGGRDRIVLMSSRMAGLVLEPAANCIMRFINDARGTRQKPNCVLFEEDVDNLGPFTGHQLLEVLPMMDIAAGAQLFLDHKVTYFTDGHIDDPCTPVADDNKSEVAKRRTAHRRKSVKTGQPMPEYEDSSDEDEQEDDEGDPDVNDEGEETDEEGDYEPGPAGMCISLTPSYD
jgi:hypothetical protein